MSRSPKQLDCYDFLSYGLVYVVSAHDGEDVLVVDIDGKQYEIVEEHFTKSRYRGTVSQAWVDKLVGF